MKAIILENIRKKYNDNVIFDNFNLEVEDGDFVGIKGNSGRGKTTLLNIIGLLEKAEGNIKIYDETVNFSNKKQKLNILKTTIGYLFQNYALVDDLTVYENLKIVLEKKSKKETKALMVNALNKVGLNENMLFKKVCTCSGGEQQRIAIARLILKKCKLVLADEPTGSLDPENTKIVMNLLKQLNHEGKTILLVSHDSEVISNCKRIIDLE